MRISNISGMWAWTNLYSINNFMMNLMEQLTTANRIPSASFDVAGLAIANTLRAQMEGYSKAMENAQYGVNLLSTAEGGMSSIQEDLQRMRELAVQAANGTLTDADRAALQEEFDQLRQGIAQTVENTQYNGQNVLEGYKGEFQTGPNEGETLQVEIPNLNPENITAKVNNEEVNLNDLNISTAQGANQAVQALDQMINQVSQARSNVGAYMNRLESGIKNMAGEMLNMTASYDTIAGFDMAQGIMDQTRLMLLADFTTGILAQSNVNNAAVLKLLG